MNTEIMTETRLMWLSLLSSPPRENELLGRDHNCSGHKSGLLLSFATFKKDFFFKASELVEGSIVMRRHLRGRRLLLYGVSDQIGVHAAEDDDEEPVGLQERPRGISEPVFVLFHAVLVIHVIIGALHSGVRLEAVDQESDENEEHAPHTRFVQEAHLLLVALSAVLHEAKVEHLVDEQDDCKKHGVHGHESQVDVVDVVHQHDRRERREKHQLEDERTKQPPSGLGAGLAGGAY